MNLSKVMFGAMVAVLFAPAARAEFWNPLDTVPKPQGIIAFDESVTANISPNCGSCHGSNDPNTRLNQAKTELLSTLPMFQNYFVYGGFTYSGCGYAKIDQRVLPNPSAPATSYGALVTMINGAGGCGNSENSLPPATGPSTVVSGCITPTLGCAGDAIYLNPLINGGLNGFLPTPPAQPNFNGACDSPASPVPTYDLQAAMLNKLMGGGFSWPRFPGGNPTAAEINTLLCSPLNGVLTEIRNELAQCLTNPNAVWDMTFLSLGVGTWCNPGLIAGDICNDLSNTCVCDPALPGCDTAVLVSSECGNPFVYKARQQVAVCEAFSTQPGRFGSFFQSQADNRINGGCRENVLFMFTDGHAGNSAGAAMEANDALLSGAYTSLAGVSNMFVFRTTNCSGGSCVSSFNQPADALMTQVSGGAITSALLASDSVTMQESFSRVLNRMYKGVYSGSSVAFNGVQDRVAVHSFTVPGNNPSGPTDTYLGFPSRISWHSVNRNTGALNPNPIFQTDWNSKVTGGTGGCGPVNIGGTDVPLLGPGGTFRNGIARTVNVAANSTDRTGDDAADPHPLVTYGRSYGTAAGKVVVVEAPREAASSADAASFFSHVNAVRTRPRGLYYMTNGYVLGIHGGTYQGSAASYTNPVFTYNDGIGAAGTEILRYRPSWLNTASVRYNYGLNDLVQQPLMTGEMIARELKFPGGPGTYRTVLIGAQGKEGRGYFTLNITNPCAPSLMAEWQLPAGSYASARPAVYSMPRSTGPTPAVFTTGGIEGSPRLYAYDISNGALLSQVTLPGGGSTYYPTEPVCLDAASEGRITHCYVLRNDGYLARVRVTVSGGNGAFAPFNVGTDDATPYSGGVPVTIGASRQFFTAPVAYFGNDGAVNLVFGSGDYRNLTMPSSGNAFFRAVDRSFKRTGPPTRTTTDGICTPDGADVDGVFPLGANERIISPALVEGGIVAWTSYRTDSNGCVAGTGRLFAMQFETCRNAIGAGNRPVPVSTGNGIPSTPVLHRKSETLYVQTSAAPTASQGIQRQVQLRGNGFPVVKRLYWKPGVELK